MSFKIEPVKDLPIAKRRRMSEYDEIIEQFLKGNQRYAKVSIKGKQAKSFSLSLKNRSKNKPIKVHVIQGEVYLENTKQE